ncbi:DUF7344 domain-containing protein [Haloarcula salina]|uniref:DUF7344 domain-containing protein n=1 Tax=Haloarcula salina TaxID=1429914 RepID=A0AA41KII6_9EURY|nr:hypothetical protein [Haloarcula salina]MBV0901718.1 hypothetical protein [Haloarcula salina]
MTPVIGLASVGEVEERTVTPDNSGIDDDTAFDILGNERRRACLNYLAGRDGSLPVSDLGRAVAREVTDPDTDEDDLYDSVYISLCQSHLPRLDSVGLVEYDRDEKLVETGPSFGDIDHLLDAPDREPDSGRPVSPLAVACVATVCSLPALIVSPPALSAVVLFGLAAVNLVGLGLEYGPFGE